jgi:hypothetical protein
VRTGDAIGSTAFGKRLIRDAGKPKRLPELRRGVAAHAGDAVDREPQQVRLVERHRTFRLIAPDLDPMSE